MRESGSRRAYPHRLVPLGIEYPRAFAVQSMVAELAMPPTAIKRICCWELIGSPRIVKLDSVKDL